MALFGGRSHGRRPNAPSSSSCFFVITLVTFLALGFFGFWMLTSTSVIPFQVIHRHFSGLRRGSDSSVSNSSLSPPPGDLGSGSVSFDENSRGTDEKLEVGSGGGGKNGDQKEEEMRQGSEGDGEKSQKEERKENTQKSTEEGGENKVDAAQNDLRRNTSKTDLEGQGGVKQEQTEGDNEEKILESSKVQAGEENEERSQQWKWISQADGSKNENKRGKESSHSDGDGFDGELGKVVGRNWELCNVTAGPNYIPCLDNEKALKKVHKTGHFEHRERHCPQEGPKCLVPLPVGYTRPIRWPESRSKVWFNNVPSTKLVRVKGHQNWVNISGGYLVFPGGGTQFKRGALHYIDFLQKAMPLIVWGKHTRVILDVGCGVASFGGYLFERDVLAMSFAPKDEHEAQVQFALERGIPAVSAVMGTQRLPFPSNVFDMVHCARCRVRWHNDGGALLLELNRVLRPGGYFVWSATPVYQKLEEDVQIWNVMSALTTSMCWDLVTVEKESIAGIGAAIYRKPISNECYDKREVQEPPMCKEEDDADAAWYVPLQSCMHKLPIHSSVHGSHWPVDWPDRLMAPPHWLNSFEVGIYGKPPVDDLAADFEHWKQVVDKSYLTGMDIEWSNIRNVMDMRAVYGGFAAALKELDIWVMNVVNIDSLDTLPLIYERGLFGIYHNWCESFSTYPRTYDLLHADHLLSGLRKRCDILPVLAEVDRILRPGGKLIVRDEPGIVREVETMLRSLHWYITLTLYKGKEGILCAEKTEWRPNTYSTS